jgi:hypothetical protein
MGISHGAGHLPGMPMPDIVNPPIRAFLAARDPVVHPPEAASVDPAAGLAGVSRLFLVWLAVVGGLALAAHRRRVAMQASAGGA